MEIFHGGYFDNQLDGLKKYKVPRFNKTGGKIYLDGLDPDKISWVEMNNIAYSLGYRKLPISYHFKVPGSSANVGLIEIKSDGDAIEMVKMIPQKKKQTSVYIIGGRRRKYAEALADFQKDVAPDFENPLNKLSALEKQRAHFEANLFASQLYDVIDVVPLSQKIVIEVLNEDGPSQGTFASLDDIVADLEQDDVEFYVESDYDLEQDDVEFQENVDEADHVPEYEEIGYTCYCSDEHVESDELESNHGSDTKEDEDGNPIKNETLKFGGRKVIRWIRYVDIVNPKFKLCLAFPNVEQCKEAIREYAIRNQVGLWFEKNSRKKVEVNCQWGCHFRVYASKVQGWGDTMLVKTLNNNHTCSLVETSHFLTYRRIATEIKDTLLDA